MKRTLLSMLTVATLATGVFANDGMQISKETLMNNLNKVDYMYLPNLQKCLPTAEAMKTIFTKNNEALTDTRISIQLILYALPNSKITTGFDNKSLTIISAEVRDYYFFDSINSCKETANKINQGGN